MIGVAGIRAEICFLCDVILNATSFHVSDIKAIGLHRSHLHTVHGFITQVVRSIYRTGRPRKRHEMRDVSFFLLKNAFGAKMKKGIGTFCSGDSSISTLNQGPVAAAPASAPPEPEPEPEPQHLPTLEEMILQLELEEEVARTQKLEGRYRRRMSSVNSSDILRSAQNALNQYPRFSLDGRDAMYRSSFRNSGRTPEAIQPGRRSVCGPVEYSYDHGLETRFCSMRTPEKVPLAGESVIWCKPGVVAKLMGLESIPVPVGKSRHSKEQGSNMRSSILRQNLRRRAERHELERRLAANNLSSCHGRNRRERGRPGSCSGNGYCVMKPRAAEPARDGGARTDRARKHYM